MANLNARTTWIDARERLPRDGVPVAAAITGRYPADSAESENAAEEAFWLVRPMHFTTRHFSEDGTDTGTASSTLTDMSVCPTVLPTVTR